MLDFLSPMLASPMNKKFRERFEPGEWYAEEKYDGHRLIVAVGACKSNLFGERSVMAWSRNGLVRSLPTHVIMALQKMPDGLYDGELIVPGDDSSGVTEITNSGSLVYTIFDVLNLSGKSMIDYAYVIRRRRIGELELEHHMGGSLHFADANVVYTEEDIQGLAKVVWARGGEGLILKSKFGIYEVGKRSKDWIKVKKVLSATLKVVGYRHGQFGPHSRLLLEDEDGNQTLVKWKNFDELDKINSNPTSFIGRKLVIEYQNRTADGSYRHPRWDHWEE